MINAGKCPKCDKKITNVKIEDIKVGTVGSAKKLRGSSYLCSSCNAVLSVQIDPVALKSDIINGVLEKLKGYKV